MEEMIKFSPVEIEVKANPTFIVGICPGRQRNKENTLRVWEGNRSGDLLQRAIKDVKNLYLTNVFNYYVVGKITKDVVLKGTQELERDIEKLKPEKIICLGGIAEKTIKKMQLETATVAFSHPSWVIRFKHDREHWVKQLREALK